jgi:glucose-1-phosphate thymidylyltransferase
VTTHPAAARKAVVLARGLGTRMRRPDPGAIQDAAQAGVADSGVKAMIPIGRPFLDYVLSALADAGIEEVCLVIGPEHGIVREYYTAVVRPTRLAVTFAVQPEPRGTADAVAAAAGFAARDLFLVLNSDNYYPVAGLAALRELGRPGLLAFDRDTLVSSSGLDPGRVGRYALVAVGPTGHLVRLVEKPDEATIATWPPPVLVSMNCWAFGPAIFEACARVTASPRGELELPDAVAIAIRDLGERFAALPATGPVLDLSTRADIAEVARRLRGVEVRL